MHNNKSLSVLDAYRHKFLFELFMRQLGYIAQSGISNVNQSNVDVLSNRQKDLASAKIEEQPSRIINGAVIAGYFFLHGVRVIELT